MTLRLRGSTRPTRLLIVDAKRATIAQTVVAAVPPVVVARPAVVVDVPAVVAVVVDVPAVVAVDARASRVTI